MNRLVIIANRFNKIIILRRLFIVLSFFLTVSCFNKTSNFIIYKEAPFKNGEKMCVKIDGMYLGKYDSYFFYSNGLVKRVFIDSSYISNYNWNSNKIIKGSRRFDDFEENWGHYKCDGRQITMQIFNKNNQEFYTRQIIEMKIKVIDDNTFSLDSSKMKADKYFMKEDRILNFYKTNNKPDSTRIWFINKRWYKENVYYNR